MDISIVDERALVLQRQLSLEQAEGRAWNQKLDAFGSMEKVTSFFRRPKDDDFTLTYKEHRLQPFWHIECQAHYVYERQREYPVSLAGPEVAAVTIAGQEYEAKDGRIMLAGVEHCREEPHREVYIDGFSGEPDDTLGRYLQFPANEIPLDDIDTLTQADTIVVPPQSKATALVRDVLLTVLKSVKADKILEDHVEIQRVDLYYRPVYAFQYRWLSKEKEAVLEIDGLTGTAHENGKTFQQYMGKILDADFLFDVGVDTIDLVVPGGGIAIKLARKGYDIARKRGEA